tara:strand:+ start:2447 stop:3478 length:1032 start_codon:yes stop_codon:yes gene_type:complete
MSQTTLEESEATQSVIGELPKSSGLPDPEVIQTAPPESEGVPEFEIAVEDDTPEEDQNREVMPEKIVNDLEGDELEEFSKERGKQLKKVWHDERRAKEYALRERDAASTFAKGLLEQNRRLKDDLRVGEEALIDNSKGRAQHELDLAKSQYKAAYDAGDADAIVEAQENVVSAKMSLKIAENYVPQYSGDALQDSENASSSIPDELDSPSAVEQAQPDPKAVAWQGRNKEWWGVDRAMTSLAFGKHDQLVNAGVDPTSDEYYESIDKEMRKRFPEKFNASEGTKSEEAPSSNRSTQSQSTVVSPAKRTTSSKKVVLSNSEVRLAQRLGLSPEQYVREKMKLEA